ncbi:MAG: DUF1566 domain-containing protein [Methylococcaceae bacterium]|nr:DUF1566 domain-containing protein [Methylococcaceae bacterium]
MNAIRKVLLSFTLIGALLPAFAVAATTPDTDFTDNSDGTVTHKPTGLIWQRCAVGQIWDGVSCTGNAEKYNWDSPVNPPASFAGKNDWRVPNIAELQTLTERDNYSPGINSRYFSDVKGEFRSSSLSKNRSIWFVLFGLGYTDTSDRSIFNVGVIRLVRGGQAIDPLHDEYTPTSAFADHGDGTVIHKSTGLIWQRCAIGQTWTAGACNGVAADYTWAQAKALSSNAANKNDWRLPTPNELATIVEYQSISPAINSIIFANTPVALFWSSTPYALTSLHNAWMVDFLNGSLGHRPKDNRYKVRLVRNNPILTELAASAINLQANAFSAVETSAQFTGGIAVNGANYSRYLSHPMQQGDGVTVSGTITPDAKHIGQQADIIVVGASETIKDPQAIITPDDCDLQKGEWTWYMNTKRNNLYCNWSALPGQERYCHTPKSATAQAYWQLWKGNPYELAALDSVTLAKDTPIDLTISGRGALYQDDVDYYHKHVCINFGYRLKDGTIVFNRDSINFRTD